MFAPSAFADRSMDLFAALFAHATPSVRTFFAGALCTTARFADCGRLHLLRSGALTLSQPGQADIAVTEPALLFFPHGSAHQFSVAAGGGADLVCATVDLGGAAGNPIGEGLPPLIVLPLAAHPALAGVCGLLVVKGFAQGDGRQAALDRLFEYLLILIVRHVVASGMVAYGVLAGLADPRLSRALAAMHDEPRRAWSLEDLADAAGISRTRFATRFRAVVGRTPIDYLTRWRMATARRLLAKGRPVKAVAAYIGYDSAAAFSRVFTRVTGRTPREASATPVLRPAPAHKATLARSRCSRVSPS